MLTLAKDHPGVFVDSVWSAVKALPATAVAGFQETGTAIGEGAAVAFNADIKAKLNAIYGNDVASYQQAMLALRTINAVGSAAGVAGAGKAGGQLSREAALALEKKLDETLNAMGRSWEAGKVLNAAEIAMSKGGNISAQQLTRLGTPAGLNAAEMSSISNLGAMTNSAAGAAREAVANSYFERNGFKALDGKCGAGNCFDGVYIKGGQVIINEVKPIQTDGSIKLSGGNEGTGLKT